MTISKCRQIANVSISSLEISVACGPKGGTAATPKKNQIRPILDFALLKQKFNISVDLEEVNRKEALLSPPSKSSWGKNGNLPHNRNRVMICHGDGRFAQMSFEGHDLEKL